MYSHTTLGTNDWNQAKPFWDAVSTALELPELFKYDGGAAYGTLQGEKLFIVPPFDGKPATFGNGTHIAFLAKNRIIVETFYNAAIKNGGTDEGAPGLRPHYHANYYSAYVRDPDGNKLQAVCHSSKE